MEDRVLIKRAIVKDIANAVREKSESSAKFQVSQLGDAIRAIGGTGSAVTELAEAIAGPIAKDDISLANALAAGLTDAPAEQSWNGERAMAGGGSIKDGVAFVDKVKGESVKMVQLITNGDFSSGLSHWAKYAGASAINAPNVENGKLVVNCIADTSGGDAVAVVHNMTNSYIMGHVYLVLLSFESSNSNLQPTIEGPTSGGSLSRVKGSIWGLRVTSAKTGSKSYFKTGPAKQSGDTWSFDNVMVFDLTAMGMEDITTADEFAQRLGYASIEDLPYIPYTEGEIVSMRASEIRSKGRNLLSPEILDELDHLPLPISEILDADGNQLFPNGLNGIGDVRDEIDLARGKAIKRIFALDMGDLNWTLRSGTTDVFNVLTASMPVNYVCTQKSFCMRYGEAKLLSSGNAASSMADHSFGQYNQASAAGFYIKDASFTSAAALKESLKGEILIGFLAEPIEVDFNPAKAWYRAENGGSEELVSDGWSAPLTADIAYRGISAEEFINAITE